jgi:hypothetical protein
MRLSVLLNRNVTGALWLALTVAFLALGWWPFEPWPDNRVKWSRGAPGLEFEPPAIAFDDQLLPWSPAGTAAGFTLELQLQPVAEARGGSPHLLTVHDGDLPSRLVLCQWKNELILRVPDPRRPTGYREAAADILPPQAGTLTVTCSSAGTTFYADGRPAVRYPRFVVPPDALRGRLIIGDAADGKHTWSGRMGGLAIIHRALDATEVAGRFRAWQARDAAVLAGETRLAALYLFAEGRGGGTQDLSSARHRLELPAVYRVPQRVLFELPRDWAELWRARYLQDSVLNLCGFVPYGFLAFRRLILGSAGRPGRAVLLALLAGTALTLTIEIGQVWLPTRVSSGTDLLLNVLGTAAGIAVGLLVQGWERRAARMNRAP